MDATVTVTAVASIPCRACRQPIVADAAVCHHCQSRQAREGGLRRTLLVVLPIALTLVSLLGAATSLMLSQPVIMGSSTEVAEAQCDPASPELILLNNGNGFSALIDIEAELTISCGGATCPQAKQSTRFVPTSGEPFFESRKPRPLQLRALTPFEIIDDNNSSGITACTLKLDSRVREYVAMIRQRRYIVAGDRTVTEERKVTLSCDCTRYVNPAAP